MKVINDTRKERLITLELTERELVTLVSAFGRSSNGERTEFCNQYGIVGLNAEDATNFYDKLQNYLGLRD